MARQEINVGATANDGTGDGLRTAYIKCNDNFQELYNTTITPTSLPNGTSNVSVADSANVTISIAGSANVVNFAGSVSEFTGNITATGDISVGNSLTITQDVTIGDQLIINGSFGSNVLPDTNLTRTLGNATLRFLSMNTGTVDASGNITSGANIAGANIIASRDVVIAGNHVTTGNVTSTGNISGGNIITTGRVVATGNLVTSAQVVATGNITGLNITATGSANVTAGGFFVGDGGFLSNVTAASNVAVTQIANGTSVVGISSSGGNVELTSGGTLSFQTNGTNLDILIPTTSAANVTTTANVSGGNLLTGGRVVATGNIVSSGNVSGTNFLGNGSFLTGISTNSISNGTSNVTVASGAATTIGVAGTTRLTIAATGTTVDGVMTATGNITATGNVEGGNLKTGGAVIATGAVTGATLAGDGSALTALNGTNIATGTVAAARVATLNQNTTGSAATLTTARAIALSGDVVGTADFDGSAGISIATTIQANSVALGTDTTGNYVAAGAVAGNGLTGSAGAEGATFTVTSNATNLSTASTIVFRDASSNFNANVISATATLAQYADVAEMYLSDHDYEPGTVITIGGVLEITVCGLGDYPAGVISTDPAYLMNSELTAGLPVALVGRVPVRVFGSVMKGQKLYSDLMGRASKNADGSLVAISLEDNADEGEKLVECMLKV
jgi:filamentous hemagglutinin